MSVSDYLRRLVGRWRVILVVAALCLAATVFATSQMTPTYTSKAQLYVSNDGGSKDMGTVLSAGVYAQQRVLSYAAVATSERMAKEVIDDLNLADSPREVSARVATTVEFGTVLIDLTATGETPETARALADSVVEQYNEVLAEVDNPGGEGVPVEVSVLMEPSLPDAPTTPNVPLNLLAGLFAGLLLGVGAAALRDLLDNSVKDADDLERPGLAPLGDVPKRPRKAAGLVVASGDRSPVAEAMRQVRVNLQYASIDDPPKKFLVTSCSPAEGKSFFSANLAAVFAQAGQSVVLVDADLRRPSQARVLGVEHAVGVTTTLVGRIDIEHALQETEGGFHLLASGSVPPNPSELLGSSAMVDLVRELEKRFDLVIVDSPPMIPFADARTMARLVDGVILVAHHGSTSVADLARAADDMREVGGRLLGCVINKTPLRGKDKYGYYAYSHKG